MKWVPLLVNQGRRGKVSSPFHTSQRHLSLREKERSSSLGSRRVRKGRDKEALIVPQGGGGGGRSQGIPFGRGKNMRCTSLLKKKNGGGGRKVFHKDIKHKGSEKISGETTRIREDETGRSLR